MNSGAGGSSPIPKTSRVIPFRYQHPSRPSFFADVQLLHGDDQGALSRRHDRGIVDPGPVAVGCFVSNFDIKVDGLPGFGEQVGLQEVEARPVLRLLHACVVLVESERLAAFAGVFRHEFTARKRAAGLERGDHFHLRGRRVSAGP